MPTMSEEEIKRAVFNEFYILVRDMRAAQRAYFATRTSEALENSKRLEYACDTLVKKIADKSAFHPEVQIKLPF